ncbi:MAG: DNA repair protein RecN, partial [Cyanobacteria bacterium P01_F01_bin.42]
SVILDAVDALLGAKVTSRLIRTGARRAIIEGQFRLTPKLKQWLDELDIELLDEEIVTCSREISLTNQSTRSRSRVNGVLVNRQQIESLRTQLVEITAQGQTVQMSKSGAQRDWLDAYGGDQLLKQRDVVSQRYSHYQQAKQALDQHQTSSQQRLQQIDLLKFQLDEFQRVSLESPTELESLEQEYQRLVHSSELKQNSVDILEALYDNEQGRASADLIGTAIDQLNEMLTYDEQLQPILEMLNDALTQVQEAARQMNQYENALETDPARLQDVEVRLTELKLICRKYGPTLQDAIAYQEKITAELEKLLDGDQSLEGLKARVEDSLMALTSDCSLLTEHRLTAARKLQSSLLKNLKPLAMEKAQFKVNCQPITPTATGSDRVQFMISPNPGEPLQPLVETASGGEMSRFLLALKSCFSQIDPVGTLIFDEIDTGVSGRVTQAIAEKLHQLSIHHQVLCVTHQPIVAAIADHHYRVEKQVIHSDKFDTSEERTVVRVFPLGQEQKKEELAQLAVGNQDEDAIAFANSLINQAVTLRHQNQTKKGKQTSKKASSKRPKSA